MPKKFSLSLTALFIIGSLFGCSFGGQAPAPPTAPMGSAPASADAVIKMSAASGGMSQTSPNGIGLSVFCEKAAEYSGGTLEITPFFDNSLGDTASAVQGVQQGIVDVAVAGNSFFSTYVPEAQAFELPFLFDGYDQARKIVDTPEIREYLFARFEEKGFKMLALWEIGFRHITNNVRPINSMEDVKGIKIRTLPAPVQVKAWELFGALPTAIDYSELYSSLQQGVVEAQENPISEITTQKFYEIQKYLSLSAHVYTPAPIAMSMSTWEKLSSAQKEAVERAVADATAAMRLAVDQVEIDGLEIIEASGCEVNKKVDTSAFRETAQGAYDIFTDANGTVLLDLIQKNK